VKAIGAPFIRPVFARLRRLCLALPETREAESWGHPNFRAGKKTFCTFEMLNERPSIAFRLSPSDANRTLRRRGFFAPQCTTGSGGIPDIRDCACLTCGSANFLDGASTPVALRVKQKSLSFSFLKAS